MKLHLNPKKITSESFAKVYLINGCRNYSTLNTSNQLPTPIKVFNNSNDKDSINSYKELLKNKGGIYSFVNTLNGNKYIGSEKVLYLRLNEHLNNKKSNIALQKAFEKYGLTSCHYVTAR